MKIPSILVCQFSDINAVLILAQPEQAVQCTGVSCTFVTIMSSLSMDLRAAVEALLLLTSQDHTCVLSDSMYRLHKVKAEMKRKNGYCNSGPERTHSSLCQYLLVQRETNVRTFWLGLRQ